MDAFRPLTVTEVIFAVKQYLHTMPAKLLVGCLTSVLPQDQWPFLSGGTLRDVVLGESPKDIDLLVTPTAFDTIDAVFGEDLMNTNRDGFEVQVISKHLHKLKTGHVAGSRLLKYELRVFSKSALFNLDCSIQVDIRELLEDGRDQGNLEACLKREMHSRDFKMNSLIYCLRSDKVFYPYAGTPDSALNDFQLRILKTVDFNLANTFQDRRRIFRVLRLSIQHNLKICMFIMKYLDTEGQRAIQDYYEKSHFTNEYHKCFADRQFFPQILKAFAKRGLVANCGIVILNKEPILKALAVLHDHESSARPDDRLQRLFTHVTHLREALVATACLIRTAMLKFDHEDFLSDQFFNIIIYFLKKPANYLDSHQRFCQDIQAIFYCEAKANHSCIAGLLKIFQCNIKNRATLKEKNCSGIGLQEDSPAAAIKSNTA